jgi:hypothetical protein
MWAARGLVLAATCAVASCTPFTSPRRELAASPRQMLDNVYGGYVEVQYGDGGTTAGELIEARSDGLVVLAPQALVDIPRAAIATARVVGFQSQEQYLIGAGVLGTLSTLSHGQYLVITAPVWVLATSLMGAAETNAGVLSYPRGQLESFSLYARFPQGLPPGVDENLLLKWSPAPSPQDRAAAPSAKAPLP